MNRCALLRILPLLSAIVILGACATTGTNNRGELQTEYEANEVAKANMRLGVAYMQDGKYEKALEKLKRARKADPRYPTVYNMLGLLYQRMGTDDRAEDSFKQALNLAPDEPDILNNYGQFLCNQNRFADAEAAFLKSAQNPLNEKPASALTNAGTCASLHDDPDKAETYFRQALEVNPRQRRALLRMAELQYESGEYLSARGYLQRFTQVARHNASSLWIGIRIEDKLGDQDTVSSYALSLKSKFPDSEQAKLLRESGIR